jgi:hypothetical protein
MGKLIQRRLGWMVHREGKLITLILYFIFISIFEIHRKQRKMLHVLKQTKIDSLSSWIWLINHLAEQTVEAAYVIVKKHSESTHSHTICICIYIVLQY